MMAINITALLSTLLFIQTALALPFGGWFHNHKANGTSPSFPTAFPTGVFPTGGFPTGAFPTGSAAPSGYFEKRGRRHHFPSGVFPTGGFPTASGAVPTGYFQKKREHHHFPTGVAPSGGFPTGVFPTGGFPVPTGGAFVEKREAEAELPPFHGPLKAKRGFHWGFGGFGHHTAASAPTGSAPAPTGGFPTGGFPTAPTPSGGFPTAYPTAY